MPSPTSSTRPTSRVPASWSRPCMISCVRTETILSALNLMAAPLNQLLLDGFQTGAHAGVVDPVLHAHHQPPQKVRVHGRLEHRLALEHLAQFILQPFLLFLPQGHG